MQSLRQLGGGVIIAIFSVILVLGGIFLSLGESLPSASTPTAIPPTLPSSFPTPTFTVTQTTPIESPTETASPSPTSSPIPLLPTETAALFPTVGALPTVSVSCTPPSGWIRVSLAAGDTIYSLAQRYKTTAENLSAANCLTSFNLPAGFSLYVPPVPTVTVIPCGPPLGWVRTYIVQPGDTLYRIALSYNLTFTQLQRANCLGNSTTIYVGQRLWVPNIPARTAVPGVTVVPEFPTETPFPTAIPTATDIPTDIPIPTLTNTPPSPAAPQSQ